MRKDGSGWLTIIIIFLLLACIFLYTYGNQKYRFNEICEEYGYEEAVAWNEHPIKLTVMLGQPNETFVDCVDGDKYKRFYLEEDE